MIGVGKPNARRCSQGSSARFDLFRFATASNPRGPTCFFPATSAIRNRMPSVVCVNEHLLSSVFVTSVCYQGSCYVNCRSLINRVSAVLVLNTSSVARRPGGSGCGLNPTSSTRSCLRGTEGRGLFSTSWKPTPIEEDWPGAISISVRFTTLPAASKRVACRLLGRWTICSSSTRATRPTTGWKASFEARGSGTNSPRSHRRRFRHPPRTAP
jgi:hypothetical protein